jgi:tetratricopeptide (TPR) repeat protein
MLELLTEGERFFLLSDVDRAAECFQRAHTNAPHSPFPLVGLGRVALAMGKVEEAVLLFESALKRAPKQPQAITFRGVAAEASGNLTNAIEYFDSAIEIQHHYGPAHFHKGRIFAQQHMWPEAKDSLGTARALMSDLPEAHSLYATALFRCGEIENALKVLGEAAQQNPTHVDTIATLVDVLVENRQLDLAKAFLHNALQRMPEESIFASKLAAIAVRQNDMGGARIEAERVVKLNPKDEEALLFAAALDMTSLDFEAAELKLQKALKLHPRSWKVHYQLGILYDALHWAKEAAAAYTTASQLNMTAWEPLNNLGLIYLESEAPKAAQEAKKVLEQCVKLVPQHESTAPLYNLALAHVRLGEKALARNVLMTAERFAKPNDALKETCRKLVKLCA